MGVEHDTGQRSKGAKRRSAQIANRSSGIDVVEKIAGVGAESQVVALAGPLGSEDATHRTARTTTTTSLPTTRFTTAAARTTRAPAAGPAATLLSGLLSTLLAALLLTVAGDSFKLRPEAKGLAQAHVQCELSGSGSEIDRDARNVVARKHVERREAGNRANWSSRGSAGARSSACTGSYAGERGPVIELGIAVLVLPDGDVKRRTRVRHHEWADTQPVRQRDGPDEESAVANIQAGAPVVGGDPQRGTGRIAAGAGGIAVSVAEGIEAGQGQPGSDAHVEAGEHLVLVENAFRDVLVGRGCAGNRRVRVHGEELMNAA